MCVQLRLRGESGIGIYLKANDFMPCEIRFNKRGSNTCKRIEDDTTRIRVASDCVCNEML